MLDVSPYFRDGDGDELTFAAVSSDESVATVVISGSTATIKPVSPGNAAVTVKATDPGGLSATQRFRVNVEAPGPPLPGPYEPLEWISVSPGRNRVAARLLHSLQVPRLVGCHRKRRYVRNPLFSVAEERQLKKPLDRYPRYEKSQKNVRPTPLTHRVNTDSLWSYRSTESGTIRQFEHDYRDHAMAGSVDFSSYRRMRRVPAHFPPAVSGHKMT